MVLVRSKGASKFDNLTKELLYVHLVPNANGIVERYPLFSDEQANNFWDHENRGLMLAQLRFYEIPIDINP
jgi:hypothetical protein